jgi:hypothetical protein
MKVGKYYLILFAVTAILCVPVFSVVEVSQRYEPMLLADHLLTGIDKLTVVVTQVGAEPSKDGLSQQELEIRIINKLNDCGIKITAFIAGDILNISELRVGIEMLKLKDSQQYAFRIQTSLATKVSLANKPERYIKADIWWTEPAMQVVSVEGMPAKVTEVVLHQVDRFIESYLAANQPSTGVGDVKDVNNVVSVTTATKRAWPAEYKFVASKNSDVFHRPDCSSAKRIKPENLVGYNSRADALRAGKRPCKRCKP